MQELAALDTWTASTTSKRLCLPPGWGWSVAHPRTTTTPPPPHHHPTTTPPPPTHPPPTHHPPTHPPPTHPRTTTPPPPSHPPPAPGWASSSARIGRWITRMTWPPPSKPTSSTPTWVLLHHPQRTAGCCCCCCCVWPPFAAAASLSRERPPPTPLHPPAAPTHPPTHPPLQAFASGADEWLELARCAKELHDELGLNARGQAAKVGAGGCCKHGGEVRVRAQTWGWVGGCGVM